MRWSLMDYKYKGEAAVAAGVGQGTQAVGLDT